MNTSTHELDQAAERYRTCFEAYEDAKRDLRVAVIAASPGITDYEIRKRTGLSMNTIRAWLGKTSPAGKR